jgi:WD40 repeat protein/uncharacterized caspase-like protein
MNPSCCGHASTLSGLRLTESPPREPAPSRQYSEFLAEQKNKLQCREIWTAVLFVLAAVSLAAAQNSPQRLLVLQSESIFLAPPTEAVSGDGRIKAVSTVGKIELFDEPSGLLFARLPGDLSAVFGTGLALNQDGSSLVVLGNAFSDFRVWDVRQRKLVWNEIASFREFGLNVRRIAGAFTADGRFLAVGRSDSVVELWNTTDWSPVQPTNSILIDGPVDRLAFDPQSGNLQVSNTTQTFVFDLATGKQLRVFPTRPAQPGTERAAKTSPQLTSMEILTDVAFSSDGKQLLVSGNGLWLIDTRSGAVQLLRKGAFAEDLAWYPDAERFLFYNYKAYITDKEGSNLLSIDGYAATLDQAGHKLAVVGSDHQIRVLDAATGQLISSCGPSRAERDSVVKFSSDGTHLLVSPQSESPEVWDWQSNRKVFHTDELTAHPVFSPSLRFALDLNGDLYDVEHGYMLRRAAFDYGNDHIESAAFSPDEKILAIASGGGFILLIDPSTGQLVSTLPGHNNGLPLKPPVFSPDGHNLISISGEELKLWDLASGRETASFYVNGEDWLAVTPDGHYAGTPAMIANLHWAEGSNTEPLSKHNGRIEEATLIGSLLQPASSTFVPVNSGARFLSSRLPAPVVKISSHPLVDAGETEITLDVSDSGDGIGAVDLWRNGELLPPEPNLAGQHEGALRKLFKVRLSKTNIFVATATTAEGLFSAPVGIRMPGPAEAANLSLSSQAPHRGMVTYLAFSNDGQYIASGTDSGEIKIWDRVSQLQVETLSAHPKALSSLAFSPDSNLVVSTGLDGAVRVWDVRTAALVHTLTLGSDSQWPDVAAFAADMRSLAVLGPGNLVRVFSWPDLLEVRVFRSNSSSSRMLVISPDSRFVAHAAPASNSATKIRITEIETGAFQDLENSGKWLMGGFSSDGQLFAATSGSDAYIWDLSRHARLAEMSASENDRFVWIGFSKLHGHESVIAVENKNGTRTWDRANGQTSASQSKEKKSPIITAAIGGDGTLLAVSETASNFSVVDLLTNQELLRSRASIALSSVTGLSFSDSDDVLETSSGGPGGEYLHFWDMTTGSLMRSAGPTELIGNVLLANGTRTIILSAPFPATESTTQLDVHYTHGPDGMLHIDSAKVATEGTKNYAVPGITNPAGIVHAISADGRLLAASGTSLNPELPFVNVWKTADLQTSSSFFAHSNGVSSLVFSSDGRLLATSGTGSRWLRSAVRAWRTDTLSKIAGFEDMDPATSCQAFSPQADRLACSAGGRLYVLGMPDQELFTIDVGPIPITSAAFAHHKPWIAAGLQDGSVHLFDSNTGQEIAELLPDFAGGFIAITPGGFYRTGGTVSRNFALRSAGHAFPVDSFDMRYNRPDRVLRALGGDEQTAALYAAAYRKRLARSGFSEQQLPNFDHLPEVRVTNAEELPARTSEEKITVQVKAADPDQVITHIQIRVNGIPIFGSRGFPVSKPAKEFSSEFPIVLSAGSNSIEISAINMVAAESLRHVLHVTKEATANPALYLVGVGVSQYVDQRYQLQFASKDAQDVLNLLPQGKGKTFSAAYTLALLNEDATREKILAARNFISRAGVDDIVVVFFAGHGLLDRDANFYFATVDTDFSAPSSRAITFQQLDMLLDGIPARHRLLLIDACHSGEMDPGAVGTGNRASGAGKRGFGASVRSSDSFQLLSSLFTDLRQNSGTSVIAASQGWQFSYEDTPLKNGYFTHAVLEALQEGKADGNGSGNLTISELLAYVSNRVTELSNGAQSPAARQTNLEDDFVIWK